MPKLDTAPTGAELERYIKERDEASWQRISAAFTRKTPLKIENTSTHHPHDWLDGGHNPHTWSARKR